MSVVIPGIKPVVDQPGHDPHKQRPAYRKAVCPGWDRVAAIGLQATVLVAGRRPSCVTPAALIQCKCIRLLRGIIAARADKAGSKGAVGVSSHNRDWAPVSRHGRATAL